jgi:hypothetical protein
MVLTASGARDGADIPAHPPSNAAMTTIEITAENVQHTVRMRAMIAKSLGKQQAALCLVR